MASMESDRFRNEQEGYNQQNEANNEHTVPNLAPESTSSNAILG